jgi:hypothetical protein
MAFNNEIEEVKAQLKVLQSKLSFLEELEKTKSPVEEAYKDWWGDYPELETDSNYDLTRWAGFQAGYNAAYEEKVVEEPEENEWKSVALRFGEKLSGYLSDNYYELSPAAWFRWAVFNYGKGQHIKDAVRESVKWCEENPNKNPLDCLKPQSPEKLTKDKVSLYKRFYKKGWTISADDFCEIVRKFLMDEAVLEKEDYEYITFTLQKSLLEVPND